MTDRSLPQSGTLTGWEEMSSLCGLGISVLVVGARPTGLINARTLLRDGFDVTIAAKASPFATLTAFELSIWASRLTIRR